MRTLLIFLTMVSLACGNVYVPDSKVVGEALSVLITKESALVQGVFDFNDWMTKDEKVFYLPIYAPEDMEPTRLLAIAKVEVEVAGKSVERITPCAAPSGFGQLRHARRVQWFCWRVTLDDVDQVVTFGPRIRVSYTQPLINGRFYYLPVIKGAPRGEGRGWAYQMHVRGASRLSHMVSEKIDHEVFGSVLTVFLKDGEEVEVQ
jgi:hypothetical protein